ncbi:MAG: hypothetical protein WD076_06160, partial [Parvularculaceae bacterium]
LKSAFPLFPPQKDIDHFDPLLARAISWRRSINAISSSVGADVKIRPGSRLPTGEDLATAYKRAMENNSEDDEYTWETPNPEHCPKENIWAERKPPSYPRSAINRWYVGAALVGYDLNDVGVERTVIIADFESAGFGAAAVKSMTKWRLVEPLPTECWKNYVTTFMFVIK